MNTSRPGNDARERLRPAPRRITPQSANAHMARIWTELAEAAQDPQLAARYRQKAQEATQKAQEE